MGCNHNNINCGCKDTYLTTPPACPTPVDCPNPQPCSEVFDAQCIRYTGVDITCNDTTVVATNTSVQGALGAIVAYFCAVAQQITPGLFAQTEDSIPVENTTTPMSLIGNGVGTLSIPADVFTVGDSFNAKFTGHISANNNDTLQITIMAGAVTLADTGVMTLPGITSLEWTLNSDFTIRAIGGAGVASIASGGTFVYEKDASTAMEGHTFSLIENTNFDTTVSNTLEVLATWGTADPGDSIYSEMFTLKKIF